MAVTKRDYPPILYIYLDDDGTGGEKYIVACRTAKECEERNTTVLVGIYTLERIVKLKQVILETDA